MYNIIAKLAYNFGANYFITLNDDSVILTKNWTSTMIHLLHSNSLLSDFGTTGFVEEKKNNFIQFNFVSRLHFNLFNKTLYTPVFLLFIDIGNAKLGYRCLDV